MEPSDVFRFFETVRVKDLAAFRALCNALKALVIDRATSAWRLASKGRLAVLDLGCGRGGDLRKWARYRLKSYVGVDGAARCVQEALERQRTLLTQGKSSLEASFHVADLTRMPIPVGDASVDVVSCMFFLQFAFGSQASAEHALSEVRRVLRPNGLICAVLPDGDRTAQLLGDRRTQIPFGHFRLKKLQAQREPPPEPFGIGYYFSLVDEACSEYVVSFKWLEAHLSAQGFRPVDGNDGFFEPAQRFFARCAESEVARAMLRDQRCSHVDWLSLGFFSVLLARLE